jgi:hypothetical protein
MQFLRNGLALILIWRALLSHALEQYFLILNLAGVS